MKALRLLAVHQLEVVEHPSPLPAAGEVVVTLRAAALNHRDVWIKAGQYAGLQFPATLGSDGAGVVRAVGKGVDAAWLGRDVILNPSFDWGTRESVMGPKFSILGLPREGTLAEEIAVPVEQVSPKPAHLTWEEAAALPLASLTAYRALASRAGVQPGEKVLVTGIGGGTALAALQLAQGLGADVWVTSSSIEKIQRARSLGARGGFIYTDSTWPTQAQAAVGGFDVIVDSAAGAGFDQLLDVAAPGGRLVFFGGTRGAVPNLAPRKVFWKQLSLLGTTMGSPRDCAGLLALVEKERLRPVVSEVFSLSEAPKAFARMEEGAQFGKLVVRIS